jgi:hypothetical protein
MNFQSTNLSILKLYKKFQIFKTLNYRFSIDYFNIVSRMLEDLSKHKGKKKSLKITKFISVSLCKQLSLFFKPCKNKITDIEECR